MHRMLVETWQALKRGRWPAPVSPVCVESLMAAFGGAAGLKPPLPTGADLQARQALAESLSQRELEVLRLVASGLSVREIARQLVVEVSAVKKHIHHVYGKLGVCSRDQALARARSLGLL